MAEVTKNFSISTVATAPSPATSGTSLVVEAGQGTRFPTPPFNATIAPIDELPTPDNSEIVRVTAISTDTFTITRATESSTARSVVIGDRIWAGVTAKILSDLDANIFAVLGIAVGKIASSIVDAKGDIIAASGSDTPARLAVGTNGEVLQANSSAGTGLSWSAGFDRDFGFPGIIAPAGGYYSVAATALTAQRSYFMRFVPSRNMTIARATFVVTTVSGGNDTIDVGIYTGSGTTMTRVAASGATSGTLNAGTGVKSINLAASLTAETVYYAALAVGTITSGSPALAMASMPGSFGELMTPSGTISAPTSMAAFKNTTTLGSSIASVSGGVGGVPILGLLE